VNEAIRDGLTTSLKILRLRAFQQEPIRVLPAGRCISMPHRPAHATATIWHRPVLSLAVGIAAIIADDLIGARTG
jgi:hypothetical protein